MQHDTITPAPTAARAKVNAAHVIALAAQAMADPRTVRKWLRKQAVRDTVDARLTAAARELGIEAPR
jgi:hypothetical protein